jgi:hypothetical protein
MRGLSAADEGVVQARSSTSGPGTIVSSRREVRPSAPEAAPYAIWKNAALTLWARIALPTARTFFLYRWRKILGLVFLVIGLCRYHSSDNTAPLRVPVEAKAQTAQVHPAVAHLDSRPIARASHRASASPSKAGKSDPPTKHVPSFTAVIVILRARRSTHS